MDCIWTDWTWGSCSKSCDGGTQNGTRMVAQPAEHGGSECTGLSTAMQICNIHECPGDKLCPTYSTHGTLCKEFLTSVTPTGEVCHSSDSCTEAGKCLSRCCSKWMTDVNCAPCNAAGWCFQCVAGFEWLAGTGCVVDGKKMRRACSSKAVAFCFNHT